MLLVLIVSVSIFVRADQGSSLHVIYPENEIMTVKLIIPINTVLHNNVRRVIKHNITYFTS